MVDSERVAALVLLWDPPAVAAVLQGDPSLILKEDVNVKYYLLIEKTYSIEDFEEFKRIVKESLGARWDPESRSWVVRPALRDYQTVVEAVTSLRAMGARFELVTEEGRIPTELDVDDVDAAFLEGSAAINELAKDVSLLVKFKIKKDRDLFFKLVELAPYYRGRFYLPPFGRLPTSLAQEVAEKAVSSAALVASQRREQEYPVFLGNSVIIKVSEEKAEELQAKLAPYEDCDIESPEIERERRENALSYCEYRWVNYAGELVRDGRLTRLYDITLKDGSAYIRTFRGLLIRLLRHLDINISKLYADLPLEPSADFLRDYQKVAVSQALKMLALQGAATIQAATGAGKTEMAVAIAKTLLESGQVKKVFFLSLNKTLNVQAVMRFKKYGLKAGLVDSENFQVGESVVACTVQTLYRALVRVGKAKEIKEDIDDEIRMDYTELSKDKAERLFEEYMKAGLVIVDEVQHVPARTVSEVVRANPWSLRLGLSATPWRDDGKDVLIYALIGDVVPKRITSSELIEKGYLVPVNIIMLKRKVTLDREALSALEGLQGAQKYVKLKNYVFYDPRRNAEIAEVVKQLPKPVLVLVKEIKHAHELCKAIKSQRISCAVLTGKESSSQRESVLRAVLRGDLDVVVATTLADEGLDLPPLKSLVLAAGGRSQTRTLQRVGRVTRPYPGKEVGIVVDVWDDDREAGGMFYRQGLARMSLYSTEDMWKIIVKDIRQFLRDKS